MNETLSFSTGEIIGWTGVLAYVTAYALLSLGWMRAEGVPYHLLNALGGLCLVVVSYTLMDMPNLVVNALWIVIAAASLLRIYIVRKKSQRQKTA
ncbi:CBU_0592 family membrane protein [Parachryseolinea silvisoli]|jgi:hypothetical protein|uniref:CBU_0592 family membrane protein n=1 Tax=Parachryseolinea silvisoli TaxID=2873601 RepID=UPI002265A6F5|nr:hypothetical protein [Parachryseolinea silvisoli]MCD9019090.1 hypothetical protein [Parachryseolinea silvisoli]